MTDQAAPAVVRHLGIRYATAARFEPPALVPFDPSAGPSDTAGPISPQVPGMLEQMLGVTAESMSEDCLFLNVFAPEGAGPGSNLPVLYWVHGGAYVTGSGSVPWYDGGSLAARGHVVVTINYRLGALGFLGEGNWGTLDQICGLQWVRDHIAGFGGDAGNVTIFGESAGGSAVVSLLAAPAAQGLFHRVWAMSPSINQLRSLEQAGHWQAAFFQAAGVADLDGARALSLEAVLEAQAAVLAMPNTGYEMFTPTAGGEGLPVDTLAAAAANPVPLTIGTNRDENLLFLAFDPRYANADEAKWQAHVELQFGSRAAEARAAYEAARPGASPLWLISAAQTDHVFRRPAQRLAEARTAAGNATWMYWFTWASPAFGGVLGAAHALDIPFAFDNLHQPGISMLLGEGVERQGIATRFADEISSFSTKGAPSWQPFDTTDRATLRIDETVELLHDPESALRTLDA
ncbi:MAG: carboxylesterase/lipase family protein [Ilumatobacteraceae bacterium]